MPFRSLPSRVLALIVQAALVLAGALPSALHQDLAPPAGTTAPASSTTSTARPTGSAALTSGPVTLTRPGTDPTAVVRGVPPRTGLVASTPMASWIPDLQVNALASDGTYVYLAGPFTQLTNPATGLSQSHAGLARIRLSTGAADATWNPSVDGTPEALAYNSATSAVYVGGLFTTVNGAARTNLAAISTSTSATLLPFAPNPTNPVTPSKGDVRALLVDQGSLVVGGSFTQIAGSSQKNLARVDLTSGALVAGFTPAVNAGVFALNQPTGSNLLAIGGAFTMVGSSAHGYLALVNRTTGAANSWIPSGLCPPATICPVLSITSNRTQLFVAAGGPGGQAIGFDLATGARQWQIVADGNTQAIAAMGNEIFVGGHFDPTFGPALRKTLAAVDGRTGAIDPTFHPSAKSTFPGTEALLVLGSGLVVGGAQLNIGGTAQSRFAIFPATQAAPTTGKPNPGTRLGRSPLGG